MALRPAPAAPAIDRQNWSSEGSRAVSSRVTQIEGSMKNYLALIFGGFLELCTCDPETLSMPQAATAAWQALPKQFQRFRAAAIVAGLSAIALLCQCGGSQPPAQQPPVQQLAIATATLPNGVTGTFYTQTIQVTGGVSPFVWALSSGTLPHNLSLVASTTNAVTISRTPDTGQQSVAFTLQVTDSDSHVATQSYNVSILLLSDSLVLSSASLDFGSEVVGSQSAALTETLTNTAASALAIVSVSITGNNAAEFNQTSTTCGASLAAGANCTINMTFVPAQAGQRSAGITLNDDTVGSPQSVSLSGVGVTTGPNATFSAFSMPFGTQLVDSTSPPQSVALSNYGTTTLNIASITVPANFTETDNCVPSLAPGAACSISVTFMPTESGDVSGALSMADDAAGSPQTVSVSGTGSTNTPPLTGYCFATCGGPSNGKDLAECPVGEPAESPGSESNWPCGPPGNGVPVDRARACHVSGRSVGHCEIQ